jgi:S-sulfo-L-cysteine synthase (O-acetyl-L-serine-dependent)
LVPTGLKTAAKVASPLGETLLERIGNTPLLRLGKISSQFSEIEILAKAEWANPGGSVKDRAASRIVNEALRSGRLREGVALLDATSGNTGIAYAMLGAALKFPVVLCMPSNVSSERKKILNAYGAEVIFTAPDEGSDGAIRKAQAMSAAHPNKYFYADQYSNQANWQAHYYGTAQEIWEQTERRVTHFVATLGTSGTFVGATRKLKELNPRIQCISLQPDSPFHGLEGLKHMATAIVPKIYDPKLADRDLAISTEAAYDAVKRLARTEGLLIGISAGAALVGCETIARELRGPAVIVTVFPDSADKYLSERFWDE